MTANVTAKITNGLLAHTKLPSYPRVVENAWILTINRSRAYQERNAVALTLGAVLAAIFAFGTFDSFVTR